MFRFFTILAFFVIFAISAATVNAQSPQVFVSARTGVDSGICNIAQPCRTVTYALTQVQNNGQVSIIDSGDYDDTVAIDKQVTIAAAPGVEAVFSGAITNGSIFLMPATSLSSKAGPIINLRNLTIDGQGITQDGIRSSLARLNIQDCRFTRLRFGLYVNGSGTYTITNSVFRDLEQGVFIAPNNSGRSVSAFIDGSHFEGMSFAAINADTNGDNTVRVAARDLIINRASGQAIRSTAALGGASTVNVENCQITYPGIGLVSIGAGSVMRASNSVILHGTTGLASVSGGSLLTRGNNTVEANVTNGNFSGTFNAK